MSTRTQLTQDLQTIGGWQLVIDDGGVKPAQRSRDPDRGSGAAAVPFPVRAALLRGSQMRTCPICGCTER